jgi:hypothetical protein
MIFRRITYSWWYLFYSAYWTAFNLGEKEVPESNAIYFFNLLIGFHIFGVMQLLKFFGYDFPIVVLISICVIPALTIPYFSFKRGYRYKARMDEFKFLKGNNKSKTRHILLIALSLWSILFVAIGGIIRLN